MGVVDNPEIMMSNEKYQMQTALCSLISHSTQKKLLQRTVFLGDHLHCTIQLITKPKPLPPPKLRCPLSRKNLGNSVPSQISSPFIPLTGSLLIDGTSLIYKQDVLPHKPNIQEPRKNTRPTIRKIVLLHGKHK